MVLEAVDSGATEGTVVWIRQPKKAVNQRWVVQSLGSFGL